MQKNVLLAFSWIALKKNVPRIYLKFLYRILLFDDAITFQENTCCEIIAWTFDTSVVKL